MKTTQRSGKAAFTLIELMAVNTIIVILAALVVGGLSFVTEKQAKSRAQVQMSLISKALEDFKSDNGFYPPGGKTGTAIGPKDNVDPTNLASATTQSKALYEALFWDTDFDGTGATKGNGERDDDDQKNYLPELDPSSTKQGWISGTGANAFIVDPWGFPYAYRSAVQANGSPFAATQNPDFDLWSFGKNSKSNASRTHKDSLDDLWNP